MKEIFFEYLKEFIYMLKETKKRLAFYSYLLENYAPSNLHEINTAYLKQSQNKSR